jgi:hypothetical protein
LGRQCEHYHSRAIGTVGSRCTPFARLYTLTFVIPVDLLTWMLQIRFRAVNNLSGYGPRGRRPESRGGRSIRLPRKVERLSSLHSSPPLLPSAYLASARIAPADGFLEIAVASHSNPWKGLGIDARGDQQMRQQTRLTWLVLAQTWVPFAFVCRE